MTFFDAKHNHLTVDHAIEEGLGAPLLEHMRTVHGYRGTTNPATDRSALEIMGQLHWAHHCSARKDT